MTSSITEKYSYALHISREETLGRGVRRVRSRAAPRRAATFHGERLPAPSVNSREKPAAAEDEEISAEERKQLTNVPRPPTLSTPASRQRRLLT